MTPEPASNCIVAIVDDDPIYQTLTQRRLARRELAQSILIFSDAQGALEFFRVRGEDPSRLPDVILLDLNMPVMDGWEFLEAFRRLRPLLKKQVRICIVTSSQADDDRRRALQQKMIDGFFTKPVTEDQLIEVMEFVQPETRVA